MKSSLFTFIDDDPAQKDPREKELERAKALAHAATVSHQWRTVSKTDKKSSKPARRRADAVAFQRPSPASSPNSLVSSRKQAKDEVDETARKESKSIPIRCTPGTGVIFLSTYNTGDGTKRDRFRRRRKAGRGQDDGSASILLSVYPGFGSFRGELFSSVPNGENRDVRTIVDFYSQSINPANDLVTELFDVTNVYSTYIPFLSCPLFHHAGLTLVGIIHERLINPTAPPSKALLELKGRTLKSIRTYLQRSDWQDFHSREGLLTAIMFLALFEGTTGQANFAQQHMLGLKKTVDALGGLRSLPTGDRFQERTNVMFFESTLAIIRGVSIFQQDRRHWHPIYYPSPPFDDRRLRVLFPKLPPGFQALMTKGKLSLDLIKVLHRAINIGLGRTNTAAKQRARAERRGETRTYPDFIEACPLLMAPDSTEDDNLLLDKMLCYALMLFCCVSLNTYRLLTSMFRASRMQLTARVQTFRPRTLLEEDCWLWMCLIAIDSQRVVTASTITTTYQGRKSGNSEESLLLTDDGETLLEHFRSILPDRAGSEWLQVERVLKQFFWTDDLSRFWSRVWWRVAKI